MTARPGFNGTHLLTDVERIVAQRASDALGTDHTSAEALGRSISLTIAQEWGGLQIYIPMSAAWNNEARRREVWAAFDGHNAAAVAKAFNISMAMVYRIVQKERARHRAERSHLI